MIKRLKSWLDGLLRKNPPCLPPVMYAPVTGYDCIILSWQASAGASGYNVKRSSFENGPYVTIAKNIPDLTYTDYIHGGLHYYEVTALN